MKWIFALGGVLSVLFGALCGRMQEVSEAAIGGGIRAVELFLVLLGGICFWSGVMKVAQKAGLTVLLAKAFSPILRRLFRKPSDQAVEAISMNVSANLLGLGNAATPFGIQAMRELKQQNPESSSASHNMILFCVLNTASLQLIPTTVATLRLAHGSSDPMMILPPMLLSSFCALLVSILAVKLCAHVLGDRL